ncbi:hypothetical protein NDU88_012279 [Pleurodeles waltl]|uniref:Complex I-B14.5a n=1 Tax=Pleurodeles waltl TaxID=8319 RepID=A0AAV7R2T2_PLEWA|nr:hypothetical protein NDU88_012279 [Pleurodeles waltl]
MVAWPRAFQFRAAPTGFYNARYQMHKITGLLLKNDPPLAQPELPALMPKGRIQDPYYNKRLSFEVRRIDAWSDLRKSERGFPRGVIARWGGGEGFECWEWTWHFSS